MKWCLVLLAFLVHCGCSLDSKESIEPAVYLSLSSEWGTAVKAEVFAEGADGNALTGSLVTLKNPGNEVELLRFDWTKGCYTGSFESFLSGDYTFSLTGRAFKGGSYTLTVPHQALSAKAEITSVADALGNSAGSGKTLDKSKALSMTWTEVPKALYQVQILKDFVPLWTGSSEINSLVLPSGTITAAGGYSVVITAQYSSGDILYKSANYSSHSLSRGAAYYFQVQ